MNHKIESSSRNSSAMSYRSIRPWGFCRNDTVRSKIADTAQLSIFSRARVSNQLPKKFCLIGKKMKVEAPREAVEYFNSIASNGNVSEPWEGGEWREQHRNNKWDLNTYFTPYHEICINLVVNRVLISIWSPKIVKVF